jgi:hypothetical protein
MQVGHLRTAEGYKQLWFDQEYVSRELEKYTYYLKVPDDIPDNAYIYFTVESYYQ